MVLFAFKLFFVLYYFYDASYALNYPSACELSKCDSKKTAIFKPQHTYVYNYDFEIGMEKRQNNQIDYNNTLKFNATVEIYADNTCNLILKLYDVFFCNNFDTYESKIHSENKNTTPNNEISDALSKNLLIFQYDEGQITNICVSPVDPNWVVSIKLGILSALQYTWMNETEPYNITELNVVGECNKIFRSSEEDGWRFIRQETNLNNCVNRVKFYKSNHNLLNKFHISTSSIVKNRQKCRHVIGKTGQPILITCREYYVIQPFSDDFSKSNIKQQLDLDRVIIKDIPPYRVDEYESLEHRQPFYFEDNDLSYAATQDLYDVLKFNIKLNVNTQNHQIIEVIKGLMKEATYNQLKSIYNSCNKKERSFFIQLLENVLTNDAFEMSVDLYQKREITDDEFRNFLSFLPFIENPSINLLTLLKPLVQVRKIHPHIMFGVSSLIQSLCIDLTECMNNKEIINIMKIIENPVNSFFDSKQFENIFVSLESICNTGFSFSEDRITLIIQNKSLPLMLKIAALNTYGCIICNQNSTKHLIQMLKNQDYDSSIRIQAFINIMRCPTEFDVNAIFSLLDEEEVNKVTYSIWNYFVQLHHKKYTFMKFADYFMENKDLQNKYSDSSTSVPFVTWYNVALFNGSNVIDFIESKNSKIQSVRMRALLDIFNQSVNIFEFGGQLEGLEYLLKDNTNLKHKKCLDEIEEKHSYFEHTAKGKERGSNFEGHFYINILDHKIYYINASTIQKLIKKMYDDRASKTTDNKFLKDFEVLNVSYKVPTIVGLPLDLFIRASVDLNIDSTIKLRDDVNFNCKHNPQNYLLLKASAFVESSMEISMGINETKKVVSVNKKDHSKLTGKLNHIVKSGHIYASYDSL